MIRIIHISDLHLSKDNFREMQDYYLKSFIEDISKFNREKKIDLIFITGDLIDKGGSSFKSDDCFEVLKKDVIDKIANSISLDSKRVLIVSGNHDIQEQSDVSFEITANGIESTLKSVDKINKYLIEYSNGEHDYLKKQTKFHNFEKEFYKGADNAQITFFENCFVFDVNGTKVGVAALNSSWNCSTTKKTDLFVGTNQLHNANKFFQSHNTDFNVGLSHYPPEFINQIERKEFESFLKVYEIRCLFCGHIHENATAKSIRPNGGELLVSSARSAFNNPREAIQTYQPGYSIIDVDTTNLDKILIDFYFRKYIHDRIAFDADNDAAENGQLLGLEITKSVKKEKRSDLNVNINVGKCRSLSSDDWFKEVIKKLKNAENAHIYLRAFQHPEDAKPERKIEIESMMKIFASIIYDYSDRVRIVANTGTVKGKSKAKMWLIEELINTRNMSKTAATKTVDKCIFLIDKPKFGDMFSIYIINDKHILYAQKSAEGYVFAHHEFENQIIPELVKVGFDHSVTKVKK